MIYSCIDIGSDTIKIVVGKIIDNTVYILSKACNKMLGVKRGIIINKEMAIASINEAIAKTENDLGFRIDKAIVSVPIYDLNITVYHGKSYLDGEITGEDVITCFKSVVSTIDIDKEVVTVFPIDFTIDDETKVSDPKGMIGQKLESRMLVSTVPKENVLPYLEILEMVGIEVIDLSIGLINDFYNIDERYDERIKKGYTALVDLGKDKCEVGIFNKGLLIRGEVYNVGSKLIDHDISYIYQVDKENARALKENLAFASSQYASREEEEILSTIEGDKVVVTQDELSQIVEARLMEILKNVKNSINNLTNHKISYIIVTGGISNLPSFDYLINEVFKEKAVSIKLDDIGIRNNIYTTAVGMIKYYHDKLKIRGTDYTMYENLEELIGSNKEKLENNILSEMNKYMENN